MKRSSQVALVLMGVTATTAAGAYMMPARSSECRPEAQRAAPAPNAGLPAAAGQEEPCRRRRSSWGTWNWGSRSSSYDRPRPASSRPSGSVSTALSPSKSTSRPSTGSGTVGFKSTSSSSTSRGGFGSTSRGLSSSGS